MSQPIGTIAGGFSASFIEDLIRLRFPALTYGKQLKFEANFLFSRPNAIGDLWPIDQNVIYWGMVSVESDNLWEFKIEVTDANNLIVDNYVPILFRTLYAKSTLKSLYFTGFKITII